MSVHNFKQRKKYIFRFVQLLRQFLFHVYYMMIVIQVTLVRQLYPLLFWHEAAFCKIFLCCTITSPRKGLQYVFADTGKHTATCKRVLFGRGRESGFSPRGQGKAVSLRFLGLLGPFHWSFPHDGVRKVINGRNMKFCWVMSLINIKVDLRVSLEMNFRVS